MVNDNYVKAYKKKMGRKTHIVKGNAEPIEITNKSVSYGNSKNWNISHEIADKKNRAQRTEALVKSGIATPDYYSPSSDPFLNQPNITRKRK